MVDEAVIEALQGAFTLESLKEARDRVAINLATEAGHSLEVNLKRVDGRETSGIRVVTYEQKVHFLRACRATIARMEGRTLSNGGSKADFGHAVLEP